MSKGPVVKFDSGATRSVDKSFDPEGFLSPRVLERFSEYMELHRTQADGQLRASDNWQAGMDVGRYNRSLARHYLDYWLMSRGYAPHSPDSTDMQTVLCAVMFNVHGLLYEVLRVEDASKKNS